MMQFSWNYTMFFGLHSLLKNWINIEVINILLQPDLGHSKRRFTDIYFEI